MTPKSNQWDLRWYDAENGSLPGEANDVWDEITKDAGSTTIFQDRQFVERWFRNRGIAANYSLSAIWGRHTNHENEVFIPLIQLPRQASSLWSRRVLAAGEPNFDFQDPIVLSLDKWQDHKESFWHEIRSLLQRKSVYRFTICRMNPQIVSYDSKIDVAEKSWKTNLSKYTSLEDFLKRSSSNLRGDVRRRLRRLEEFGEIQFDVYEPSELERALAELPQMRAAFETLWKGTPAEGLFRHPGIYNWYQEVIRQMLPTRQLHFSKLACGRETIAWHFGFLYRNTLHWYKPSYNSSFASFSPGKVMLAKVVEWAIQNKIDCVDYGPGMEPYKSQWSNHNENVFRWEWNNPTMKYRILNAIRNIKYRITHVKRSFRV
jgi:CelD/BcsL family acetyltransferase involved in cellulose biosynthesis